MPAEKRPGRARRGRTAGTRPSSPSQGLAASVWTQECHSLGISVTRAAPRPAIQTFPKPPLLAVSSFHANSPHPGNPALPQRLGFSPASPLCPSVSSAGEGESRTQRLPHWADHQSNPLNECPTAGRGPCQFCWCPDVTETLGFRTRDLESGTSAPRPTGQLHRTSEDGRRGAVLQSGAAWSPARG